MKMMKNILYFALVFAVAASCDRSDPGGTVDLSAGSGSGLGDHEQANAAIAAMNEKYDVQFKYVFSETDLGYNWTELIDMKSLPTEPADPEYIAEVMDFLDKEVFSAFPEGLIKKALPPVILLVSECKNPYSITHMPPKEKETGYNYVCGFCTSNVMILSDVGPRFKADRDTREKLISLIVERMVANTKALPPADKFYEPIESTGNWLIPGYWSGNLSDSHYFWDTLTSEEQVQLWQWKNSFLRTSKLVYRYVYFNSDPPTYTPMKNSKGEDLGNYYVFTAVWTQQERNDFYDMVYQKVDETFPFDAYDTHDAQSTIDAIKAKVQLAKRYFNDNYGTDIPASVE